MSHNPKSSSNRLAALWREQTKKVGRLEEELVSEQESSVAPSEAHQATEALQVNSSSEANIQPNRKGTLRIQRSLDSHIKDVAVPSEKSPSIQTDREVLERQVVSESESGFREFERRWSPVLRQGQMKVCEALYKNTIALGCAEYDTSLSRLGGEVGLQVRQVRNLLGQLQVMGFVVREEITHNQRTLGTRIRFFLDPHK
jgi:hypothetical protein